MPGNKISVATTWLQSCSGCHIALLDLHEEIIDVLELIDIKYSPVMDIKEIPKVNLAIIEGSVANEENEEVLREMREKADILLSLGSCACFGGVPGMRNFFRRMSLLKRVYEETESTEKGKIPKHDEIPKLLQSVKPLHDIVEVDYSIPGCPPLPSMIKEGIVDIIEGREPKVHTHNLCIECKREHIDMLVPKREFITDSVKIFFEIEDLDNNKCFLEQGVLCMGPATREGCGSRCIKGNFPCRGCMGPTPDALEQGAKMINAISSILPAGALMFLEDVVGTGYRYSAAVSIFPTLLREEGKKDG